MIVSSYRCGKEIWVHMNSWWDFLCWYWPMWIDLVHFNIKCVQFLRQKYIIPRLSQCKHLLSNIFVYLYFKQWEKLCHCNKIQKSITTNEFKRKSLKLKKKIITINIKRIFFWTLVGHIHSICRVLAHFFDTCFKFGNYLFKCSNKNFHNRLAKVFYVNATNIFYNRINQIQNW